MKKKKLFCVSDLHGHFTELKKALNDAGFKVIDDRTENGWYAAALRKA